MFRFKTIEHTADVGIEVEAGSLPELFEGAAHAMFSLVVDEEQVNRGVERAVRLEAADPEELMFRWLNELVFLVSGEGLVLREFEVRTVTDRAIDAVVSGEPIDTSRHDLGLEVKAATYHELEVSRRGEGWFARAIFDV